MTWSYATWHTQVHKSLQRIRERKLANFIPWGPASIQVLQQSAYKSPGCALYFVFELCLECGPGGAISSFSILVVRRSSGET